jgi:hypothetical protein
VALLGRRDGKAGPSVEDERDALRRQRLEAARELDALKAQLAERVAAVQMRERQLEKALAQAGTIPAGPPAAPPPPSVLPRVELPPDPAVAAREAALDRREQELSERDARLVEREERLAELGPRGAAGDTAEALELRTRELDQRGRALAERAQELDQREQAIADRARDPDEEKLRHIEERLAELKEAERIFLRTQQELADRSEAVAARERLVADREREVDEREDGWQIGDLAELERRLRRLEQGAGEVTQTFSGGLARLRKQGTRGPSEP